jgi:hypothetical protein
MIIMNTYKYYEDERHYCVSPVKPDCEYTEAVRLIAEEGHAVTNDGINYYYCIDVDSADGWLEIPGEWTEEGVFITADNATEADYLEALAKLGVK